MAVVVAAAAAAAVALVVTAAAVVAAASAAAGAAEVAATIAAAVGASAILPIHFSGSAGAQLPCIWIRSYTHVAAAAAVVQTQGAGKIRCFECLAVAVDRAAAAVAGVAAVASAPAAAGIPAAAALEDVSLGSHAARAALPLQQQQQSAPHLPAYL